MRLKLLMCLASLALALSTPLPIYAQISDAQLEQYRQRGARLGLTPAQVTQVFRFIDSNEGVIMQTARQNRVNEQAFRAIALELGLRNHSVSPNRLLEAIQKKAEDAAKFETEIANLRSLIGVMEKNSTSTAAALVISRADEAYISGDLDSAEDALEELIDLRNGQLIDAYDAWEAAHRAAVQLASSRDDIEKLEALVSRAREARRLQRERLAAADRMADWQDQMILANAYFKRQFLGSDLASLQKAILIYRDEALPLISRESHPFEWAFNQYRLGFMFNSLANYEGQPQRPEEAIAAFRLALEELTPENAPNLWLQAHFSLGSTLDSLESEKTEMERVLERIAGIRMVLDAQNSQMDRFWLQMTQFSLGSALVDLDRLRGADGTDLLEEAIEAYRLATIKHPDRPHYEITIRSSHRRFYALTLEALANREGTTRRLEEAIGVYQSILKDMGTSEYPRAWTIVTIAQTKLMIDIAEKDRRSEMLIEAWKRIQELERFLILNPNENLALNPNENFVNDVASLSARSEKLASEAGWSLPDPADMTGPN